MCLNLSQDAFLMKLLCIYQTIFAPDLPEFSSHNSKRRGPLSVKSLKPLIRSLRKEDAEFYDQAMETMEDLRWKLAT